MPQTHSHKTYSNPRQNATFNDWPLGGNKRGTCTFTVHQVPKKGQRVSRQTTGKPKFDTYVEKAVIVDGSDGRTYIVSKSKNYNFIKVSDSSFMDEESAFPESQPERFAELAKLLD